MHFPISSLLAAALLSSTALAQGLTSPVKRNNNKAVLDLTGGQPACFVNSGGPRCLTLEEAGKLRDAWCSSDHYKKVHSYELKGYDPVNMTPTRGKVERYGDFTGVQQCSDIINGIIDLCWGQHDGGTTVQGSLTVNMYLCDNFD